MQAILGLVIIIVIISAVVGAIAQVLNKLNEMANPPRPPARPARAAGDGGTTVRQSDKDMDRFLAEIDRLRKKNAEGQQSGGNAPANAPATPVAKPVKPSGDRSRPRVVAELAEPQPQGQPQQGTRRATDAAGFTTRLERREATDAAGFTTPPAAPISPITTGSSARPEDLPVATVVSSGTGAPATQVTRLPTRARPAPKTVLARNLTDILNSGQGVAMAVILQEVLGPPKSRSQGSGDGGQ